MKALCIAVATLLPVIALSSPTHIATLKWEDARSQRTGSIQIYWSPPQQIAPIRIPVNAHVTITARETGIQIWGQEGEQPIVELRPGKSVPLSPGSYRIMAKVSDTDTGENSSWKVVFAFDTGDHARPTCGTGPTKPIRPSGHTRLGHTRGSLVAFLSWQEAGETKYLDVHTFGTFGTKVDAHTIPAGAVVKIVSEQDLSVLQDQKKKWVLKGVSELVLTRPADYQIVFEWRVVYEFDTRPHPIPKTK